MKEIRAIVESYHKIDFTKNKVALATVVRVEGSSYRRTGARMLITDSGDWIGGISGGCLEGDALKKAKFAMAQNKATMVTYDTTDDDPYQIGVGLGCNGIIDVLLAPINSEDPNNQVLTLQNCIESRKPNVIVTITNLKGNFKNIQLGDAFIFDSEKEFSLSLISEKLTNDIESCLKTQNSATKAYKNPDGEIQLFIEVIPPVHNQVGCWDNYFNK